MHNGRQSSKKAKDKIKLMKRFIMGEDVVNDILNDGVRRITGFHVINSCDLSKLSTDQLNELRLITDEKERSKRLRELLIETSNNPGFTWLEGKTYGSYQGWQDHLNGYKPCKKTFPDPEIDGVSYSRAENLPVIETSELSEDSNKTETDARKEARNALKRQNINSKKLEADQLIQTMKTKRDEANRFMERNREFSSGWFL